MHFEIPRGADREYLIVFGVAAIYLGTVPCGEPCIVGASRDLDKTYEAMHQRWPWSEISCAYWVKDRDTAEAIANEVNGILPHDLDGRLAVRVEDARRQIERVACEWKISLTNHDAAMARVHAAVRRVEEKISEANARGELAWFNAAYRDWRIEAKKIGRVMSYSEALARLRKEVTKRLITLDILDLGADILPAIFPDLRKPARKNLR